MRWWYTGDAQPNVPLALKTRTVEERFWSFVSKQPNGCWYWTGNVSEKGYGSLSVNGKPKLVHRWAYEYFVGPLADGMQVDHECHNRDSICRGGWTCVHRKCVNYLEHLVPKTQSSNLLDSGRCGDRARERAASITHCPYGHEYAVVGRVGSYRNCAECNRIKSRANTKHARGLPDARVRITDALMVEIHQLASSGMSQAAIGRQLGVSGPSVCRVLNGKQRRN
jgi:hypothetical protein